jgi:NAD(P)-dependent dehydrogenase (short-subunit alcohol dehydrogenase family)
VTRSEPRFDGKVAFITGAGAGFGRAFAEAFLAEGAGVAVADIDQALAQRAAIELDPTGTRAVPVACDVADPAAVQAAVDTTVAELGGVDVLVNNAARHLHKYAQTFSSLTHDEIRGLFDVNVVGVVTCSLACRPSMADRGGGAVVNISSASAYSSGSPYGVSKVAVRGLTIALARELADDGIRVNAVAPTMTPTESVLDSYDAATIDRAVQERQLVHRRARLDDVTNMVLFLCSDEASFVTGEHVRVTGGAALSI